MVVPGGYRHSLVIKSLTQILHRSVLWLRATPFIPCCPAPLVCNFRKPKATFPCLPHTLVWLKWGTVAPWRSFNEKLGYNWGGFDRMTVLGTRGCACFSVYSTTLQFVHLWVHREPMERTANICCLIALLWKLIWRWNRHKQGAKTGELLPVRAVPLHWRDIKTGHLCLYL